MSIPTRNIKDPVTAVKLGFIVLSVAHMVYYYATVNRPGVATWEIAVGAIAAIGAVFLAEGTGPFYRKVRESDGAYLGVVAGLFNFFVSFAAGAAAAGHILGAISTQLSKACDIAFVVGLGGLAIFATGYFVASGYDRGRCPSESEILLSDTSCDKEVPPEGADEPPKTNAEPRGDSQE